MKAYYIKVLKNRRHVLPLHAETYFRAHVEHFNAIKDIVGVGALWEQKIQPVKKHTARTDNVTNADSARPSRGS